MPSSARSTCTWCIALLHTAVTHRLKSLFVISRCTCWRRYQSWQAVFERSPTLEMLNHSEHWPAHTHTHILAYTLCKLIDGGGYFPRVILSIGFSLSVGSINLWMREQARPNVLWLIKKANYRFFFIFTSLGCRHLPKRKVKKLMSSTYLNEET